MRLTCPNCGARYEVDDAMVPPAGRDVQCSSCNTTWFQTGPGAEGQPSAVYVKRVIQARPAAHQPPAGARDDDDDAGEDEAAQEPQLPLPPRRGTDRAALEILRQEAERETRLRRGQATPVETQSEMSLDDGGDWTRTRAERADLDEARDAFDDSPEAVVGARRDLLPDIEDINSTLRATGDRSPEETTASDVDTLDTGPRRRRGARAGFVLVLLVAAIAAGVYANADLIAGQVPETAPYLQSFVEQVNSARFWIDDRARDLVDLANSL